MAGAILPFYLKGFLILAILGQDACPYYLRSNAVLLG
jgi:hypothetical protein